MRVLGLDYGARTIGAAVSDSRGEMALPLETICRKEENKLRRSLARIQELCGEYGVEKIVIGLPLNMDGTEGERALLTRRFGEMAARRTGLPVLYEDERLTSWEADSLLAVGGIPRKDRKKTEDQIAAALILRSYLEKEASHGKDPVSR